MHSKKYTSFEEIDRELEILRLEREINYRKINLNIDKTKESLSVSRIVNGFLGSYKFFFSGNYKTLIGIVFPYIIKWFIKRKRGN